LQIEFLPKQDAFYFAKGDVYFLYLGQWIFIYDPCLCNLQYKELLGRLCGTSHYFNDYCLLGCDACGYNMLPLPLGYFCVLKMEALLPCHMVPHSRSVNCNSCYQ